VLSAGPVVRPQGNQYVNAHIAVSPESQTADFAPGVGCLNGVRCAFPWSPTSKPFDFGLSWCVWLLALVKQLVHVCVSRGGSW
jgi:hypothetical protein